MLLGLTVKNFVIVDALSLDFSPGLTVLTGETGAGKSIIIEAIGLLLGDRADGSLVREGAERAELSAEFAIKDHKSVLDWLEQNGFEQEENELLLRRLLEKSGRSRSFINGQPAALSQIKQLGELLIDIHGQHAHHSLLKADTQRNLLDAYAGATAISQDLAAAWKDWQRALTALQQAERLAKESENERERLIWQINELAELNLQPDEWNIINQQHSRLANAAELVQTTQEAVERLAEMDNNCLSLLNHVQSRLCKLTHLDPRLTSTLSLLDSVDAELHEVVYSLRDYSQSLDEDPSALEQMEQRMATLMSMARKYRIEPSELISKGEDWERQLATLDAAIDLEALSRKEASTQAHYRTVAEALSAKRRQAANDLAKQVSMHLHTLAMEGARFAIELSALAAPGACGLENVEFLVAANAGSQLRPLAKVASGGELSRISLALQVVTSQIASVPTLIFDEVDVGIGGRVAEVIGQLLQQLGQRYQVFCITHLAQVASFGTTHWQVCKKTKAGKTYSFIQPLDQHARTLEIARMLGGSSLTTTTQQHAEEMLSHAQAYLQSQDLFTDSAN